MNSQESIPNICRICLDDHVVSNWNVKVDGYSDLTYKDCFYKYTQLEYQESDPFSPMLCQMCLSGLYNTHSLVLQAIESHKYFQTSFIKDDSTMSTDDIKYDQTEFETVLVGNVDEAPIVDYFIYELSDNETNIKPTKRKGEKRSKRFSNDTKITTKHKKYKNIRTDKKRMVSLIGSDNENSEYKMGQHLNDSSKKYQIKAETEQIVEQYDVSDEVILDNDTTDYQEKEQIGLSGDELLDDTIEDSLNKFKRNSKDIKNPRKCSFCSKIFHNVYSAKMHEKTHIKNRERKETCNICGVKFFNKRNLNSHKIVHKENREKTHQCEFCNKAFYNKGSLNIHRRVHLGQMISCSLCTKQFYRQIDLERHMNSHSDATINVDTRKRSRYFVRCKFCDKSILSTSFKSHTAAHLNEPLMKCSICSKEFFRRESCVVHIKKIHKKINKEYNDFIILYKKNRMSHLYIAQKADIQFAGE